MSVRHYLPPQLGNNSWLTSSFHLGAALAFDVCFTYTAPHTLPYSMHWSVGLGTHMEAFPLALVFDGWHCYNAAAGPTTAPTWPISTIYNSCSYLQTMQCLKSQMIEVLFIACMEYQPTHLCMHWLAS
jgi:hypothetical protein